MTTDSKRGAGWIAGMMVVALSVANAPEALAQDQAPAPVPAPAPARTQGPDPAQAPAWTRAPAPAPTRRQARSTAEVFTSANADKFYAFGGFARLFPDIDGRLQGENPSILNLIAGGGYRDSPNLAIEINFLFSFRTFDTPPTAQPPAGTFRAGTLASSMLTLGAAATVKYNFTAGRVAPYFGGGLGIYATKFLTTSESPFCPGSSDDCANTGPRVSARSTRPGYHALAGADVYLTRKDMLAAEVRYLKLDADFGSILPGKINAGGTFVWIGYRRVFR